MAVSRHHDSLLAFAAQCTAANFVRAPGRPAHLVWRLDDPVLPIPLCLREVVRDSRHYARLIRCLVGELVAAPVADRRWEDVRVALIHGGPGCAVVGRVVLAHFPPSSCRACGAAYFAQCRGLPLSALSEGTLYCSSACRNAGVMGARAS